MTFTKYFQIVACLATLAVGAANLPGAEIVLTRVPDGGLQPQALSAPDGTTHLVYFKGNPQAGGSVLRAQGTGGIHQTDSC